jgi:hypothetical protein
MKNSASQALPLKTLPLKTKNEIPLLNHTPSIKTSPPQNDPKIHPSTLQTSQPTSPQKQKKPESVKSSKMNQIQVLTDNLAEFVKD